MISVNHFCFTLTISLSLSLSTHTPTHSYSSRALPDLVDCVDKSNLTALHWAIYYDHPQHLKLLLKK